MTELGWRLNDPFGEAMQRLWDRAVGSAWPQVVAQGAEHAAAGRFPVNIYEDGSNYYLTAMLPGVGADKVEVTTEGNVLVISGSFEPHAPDGAATMLQEMGPAQFRRQFSLGAGIEPDAISAQYDNGILSLVIGKANRNKTRRIPIGGGASAPSQVAAAGRANGHQ